MNPVPHVPHVYMIYMVFMLSAPYNQTSSPRLDFYKEKNMKHLRRLSSFTLVAMLLGCAGASYRPIVDTQGLDMNRYEADLQSCQQYAKQTADGPNSAAVGAIAGAALGSILAGVAGGDRRASGSVGAIEGGILGGVSGETNQRNIIRRCLSGRGYRVLQ